MYNTYYATLMSHNALISLKFQPNSLKSFFQTIFSTNIIIGHREALLRIKKIILPQPPLLNFIFHFQTTMAEIVVEFSNFTDKKKCFIFCKIL